MKTSSKIFAAIIAITAVLFLTSCEKEQPSWIQVQSKIKTALVTYEDLTSGVIFQLDDSTTLVPTNLNTGLYDHKTVRAIVKYFSEEDDVDDNKVKVFSVDSIRTKKVVPDLGDKNDETYGKDKIEIVRDWVTIGEDGYLTLRIRTYRSCRTAIHYVNLVDMGHEDGEYRYELRHDAQGDTTGRIADGLIAFDLNDLEPEDGSPVTLHLKWEGFTQSKTVDFKLTFRKR